MGQQHGTIQVGRRVFLGRPIVGYPRDFLRCKGRHTSFVVLQFVPAPLGQQLARVVEKILQFAHLARARPVFHLNVALGGVLEQPTHWVFDVRA